MCDSEGKRLTESREPALRAELSRLLESAAFRTSKRFRGVPRASVPAFGPARQPAAGNDEYRQQEDVNAMDQSCHGLLSARSLSNICRTTGSGLRRRAASYSGSRPHARRESAPVHWRD